MYIVAIGWMFVVVCMAAVEGTTSSLAGALVTLLGYGVMPLALVLWLLGTPQRRRNRSAGASRASGASFTRRGGKPRAPNPDDEADQ